MGKVAIEYAFPYHGYSAGRGLTLRDHFAAVALQGILACPKTDVLNSTWKNDGKVVAETAYEYADAMLAARQQDPPAR